MILKMSMRGMNKKWLRNTDPEYDVTCTAYQNLLRHSQQSMGDVVSLWFACLRNFLGEPSDFDFVFLGDILM